jgi:hypothetical protein
MSPAFFYKILANRLTSWWCDGWFFYFYVFKLLVIRILLANGSFALCCFSVFIENKKAGTPKGIPANDYNSGFSYIISCMAS